MSRSEIIGSWHNNGYYGHLRSRPRNDFILEYRSLAKPQPPNQFLRRAQQPASSHIFSKHDNRHSFLTDALYFEEGNGRKRNASHRSRFENNDLLTWRDTNPDPALSSYMVDYRGVSVDVMSLNQRLARAVKTPKDDLGPLTTIYRIAHSVDSPYIKDIEKPAEIYSSSMLNRMQKPRACFSRESVASCMTWYNPSVSGATCCSSMMSPLGIREPHPPSVSREASALSRRCLHEDVTVPAGAKSNPVPSISVDAAVKKESTSDKIDSLSTKSTKVGAF